MERRVSKLIFFILSFLLLFGCATNNRRVGVTPEEFHRLVWESRIESEINIFNEIKNIVGNNPIAVHAIANSRFNHDYSTYYEQHISEHSRIVVATRRTSVLDREFDFQFSGRVSDEEMRNIGRMLGVNYILTIDATIARSTEFIDNNSNDVWRFTLYEIERGLILFSTTDAIATHRDLINRNYYIFSNSQPARNSFISTSPFYFRDPLFEIDINFGSELGILSYWGYRPSWEEFSLVINGTYFYDYLSSSESLLQDSYLIIENNINLDERVKTFMRLNNLTFAGTLIGNDIGGFTYIVNYSFDNFRTFGYISMDSYGYDSFSDR